MHRVLLILSLGLLPALAYTQTIFKCTGPDGSISMQQTPCPGAGQRLDVRPNAAPPPPVSPQTAPRATAPQYSAQSAADADKRAVDIAAGMSAGYPVVGMTTEQLAQAMGQPGHVNFDDYGKGPREQRVYDRGGRRFYVYVERGRVTAIQHSASTAGRRSAGNCPSELDIRNLETTASSIGQTYENRAALQRQIAAMRACR